MTPEPEDSGYAKPTKPTSFQRSGLFDGTTETGSLILDEEMSPWEQRLLRKNHGADWEAPV